MLTQTLNTQEIIMSNFETPKLPEVKFNKKGYEIRTDILAMAKDMVSDEFHTKFQGWEMSAKRDEKTGTIVTTVGMPEFPGLDKVLETAEKMYAFVNSGVKK
jgi:hypothetical protein